MNIKYQLFYFRGILKTRKKLKMIYAIIYIYLLNTINKQIIKIGGIWFLKINFVLTTNNIEATIQVPI